MKIDWPTQTQDMYIARQIIAEYGGDDSNLGIFEMQTDIEGKVEAVRLSEWVQVLIKHFRKTYGDDGGDAILKRVMTNCIINGQIIH